MKEEFKIKSPPKQQLPEWLTIGPIGDDPNPSIFEGPIRCDSCGWEAPEFMIRKQHGFNVCVGCCG